MAAKSVAANWKATLMDDLMREFLTETSESLDTVDNQLVRFEQEPNNAKILDNIFRLVHTIKGTCGFLGLPRLEAIAHAGETLMGKFRDGMKPFDKDIVEAKFLEVGLIAAPVRNRPVCIVAFVARGCP